MISAIIEVINLAWPTVVLVSCVLIIVKINILIKNGRSNFVLHDEIFNLLFIVYLMVLFQLVTSQDISGGGTNFTPFKEILRYDYGSIGFYRQVLGNILLFIPFGYFMSRYCKIKNLFSSLIITVITSGVIECTQFYIGRCFDVDDIILNAFGGMIGFLIYIAIDSIKNHLPRFLRKEWFYNILSIIIVALIILYIIKIV